MLTKKQYKFLRKIDCNLDYNICNFGSGVVVQLYHAIMGNSFFSPFFDNEEIKESYGDFSKDSNGNSLTQKFVGNNRSNVVTLPVLPLSRHFNYFSALLDTKCKQEDIINVDISHYSLTIMRNFFNKCYPLSDVEEAFSCFCAKDTAYLKVIFPVGYDNKEMIDNLNVLLKNSYLCYELEGYIEHVCHSDSFVTHFMAYQARIGSRLDFIAERIYDGEYKDVAIEYMLENCNEHNKELDPKWIDRVLNIYAGEIDQYQELVGNTDNCDAPILFRSHSVDIFVDALVKSLISSYDRKKVVLYTITSENKIIYYLMTKVLRGYREYDEYCALKVVHELEILYTRKLYHLSDVIFKIIDNEEDHNVVKACKIVIKLVKMAMNRRKEIKEIVGQNIDC